MDNMVKFLFKMIFAFDDLRIFIIKQPNISFCLDAPAHDYDNLHGKGYPEGHFYVSRCSFMF
jgi:hypothetical protein